MVFPNEDTFLTGGASATNVRQKGSTKPTKAKSSSGGSTVGLLLMIILPWMMLTVIMTVFTFCYHHFSVIVWLLVLICAGMALLFFVISPRNKKGPMYMYLGFLCSLAIFMGIILGMYGYHEFMLTYYSYNEYRVYTDVLPSEPAAAHQDAGTMVFTEDSRVDTTKALGYKTGTVYCVAPILDDSQASRVEYWAAGIDCCSQRADFNCDDSWDPKAKSGVVIIDNGSPVTSKYDMYMKAVHQAEAAYGVVAAPVPIFVRWVTDPVKVEQEYWTWGIGFLVICSAIYLFVSIILGTLLHMAQKNPQ
jgi:hypothetical protein